VTLHRLKMRGANPHSCLTKQELRLRDKVAVAQSV